MNSVFLAKDGLLTSTSANYLANLAKEQSKQITKRLDSISFVNKTVELINGTSKPLRNGWKTVASLEDDLKKLSNLMSFNAWVREAIKEKDALLISNNSMSLEDFCKLTGEEYPEAPNRPKTVQQEDIINEMSIKERNRYFTLETFAATFGSYIHPNGNIAIAREQLLHRQEEPNEVQGEGRDLVIYGYTPSLPTTEVAHCYISLQNSYREYERQLNAIKASLKEEVNRRNLKTQREYSEALHEYTAKKSVLEQKLSIYLKERQEEISKLKIVLPDQLKDTYEYLNSLGK